MNKRNLLLSAFMSLGFAGAFAQVQKSNVVDEVIWVVGDEPILRSDVEEAQRDHPRYPYAARAAGGRSVYGARGIGVDSGVSCRGGGRA